MPQLDIGGVFEWVINWLTNNWQPLFTGIRTTVEAVLNSLDSLLQWLHPMVLIVILALAAWKVSGRGLAIFTFLGLGLIALMGFWSPTMETLALVITSVIIALMIGLPLGIWSSKSNKVEGIIRPALDFMQTLPAFVYLIPAVLFFQLGPVPGVIATLIFSLPPCVRFTNLGIRQVPEEIREAAISFGSNRKQLLFKAEIPVAMPTIMAGINQTIMLSLSMVVICGMIGAGGLGNEVLKGITQLKIDLGFEAGISIVILAIVLDRLTQNLGSLGKKKKQ